MNPDEKLISGLASQDTDLALSVRRLLDLTGKRGIGCWLWTGHVKPDGYGGFRHGDRNISAHRAAFQLAGGECEGKEVHHLCFNRMCVRPTHLEAVTRDEHNIRTKLARAMS